MSRAQLLLLAVAALSTAATATTVTATANQAPPAPPARFPASCPIPRAYRAAFEAAARETRLPLGLLVAVARTESRFDATAQSHAGARGLLQVLPSTAAELRLDADVPRANVLAGARYLRLMLDRFGAPDAALAAYNAGPTAVERAHGAPRYTHAYVARVNAEWRALRRCR